MVKDHNSFNGTVQNMCLPWKFSHVLYCPIKISFLFPPFFVWLFRNNLSMKIVLFFFFFLENFDKMEAVVVDSLRGLLLEISTNSDLESVWFNNWMVKVVISW